MVRKIFSIGFLIVLFTFMPVLLPVPTSAEETYTIKFASIAPEGSTWIKEMRTLNQRLQEKSKGRIRINIYAGGIAGDEMDVLRKIKIGQLHCSAFSGVGLAQILPMIRVLDLAFLFRNNREIDTVQDEFREYFAHGFRGKGFEMLSWAEVGNVHLFSKKPIRTIEDFKGLKVWTWSGDPISKETFSLMGTNPIPLSVTDVTTALNTGMIDTFYAPPLGALALQWHSYVKYMTSFPLAHATGTVLLSSGFFKKLPGNLAELLKVEFDHSMQVLTTKIRMQSEDAFKAIQASGIEIIPPPPEKDMQAFYRMHDLLAERLAGEIYPKHLLERIYRTLKRTPRD